MKKMIRISSFACLLTFFFISSGSSAQVTTPVAHFDGNMTLTIDATATLTTEYTLDFSNMTFKDETAVKMFFRGMTDNLVHWDYDYTTKTAILHLHTQYKTDWTTADWNTFLASNTERYRTVYTRANAE
ncbi:MAG: hypothetical protein ACKVPJ_08800 [Chitinophagales bacterium]